MVTIKKLDKNDRGTKYWNKNNTYGMIFYIRNTFMYENSLNLQSYRIATH